MLRRLAESLHAHHLGAISITAAVTPVEMHEALARLAREPEQHGAIGLAAADARPHWPHLRLHPLTFEGLALADDAVTTEAGRGGLRGAELWVGLARAAMAGHADGGEADGGASAASTEPLVVARAIDEHPREAAYDQVIIGYLLQIARELRSGDSIEGAALRRRTARLVSGLRPETLRRLVEMGGNAVQRRQFVLDATHGMAVEAVVDIVNAVADASGQTISHGMSRMLSKLAAHAEFGDAPVRPVADAALREQVGRLLTGWNLADPNPSAYSAVLQHLATANDGSAASPVDSPSSLESARRVIEISLEVGESGPLVERAADTLIRRGHTADLLAALAEATGEETEGKTEGKTGEKAEEKTGGKTASLNLLRARLGHPDAIQAMLQQSPPDLASLDQALPWVHEDGYAVLLDALATADDRALRRRLLDRLAAATMDIVPAIATRLAADERWFVQRNLLVLLARIGRVPAGFSVTPWVQHADVRVRHEAIRLQLVLPDERAEAVRAALEDGHPRLVHSGLAAVLAVDPTPEAGQAHVVALGPAADEFLDVVENRLAQIGHAGFGRADDSGQPRNAIERALGIHGFADAIGKDRQKIAGSELPRVLLVLKVRIDTQRQAGFAIADALDAAATVAQ